MMGLSLVILAVLFCYVQSQQVVGTCTLPQIVEKSKSCYTTFVHDMQKNPKSDCSVELQAYIKCNAKELRTCFGANPPSEHILTTILQSSLTKDLVCKKAGLQFPGFKDANSTRLCNTTVAQYTNNINRCSKKVLEMWQANRADTEICGEYVKTKQCISKVITELKCLNKTRDFQDMVKLSLGNYNPFCSTGIDPTSAASQTSLSKGLIFLSTAALFKAFF